MPPYQQKVPLVGSERVEPAGARRVGPANREERIEVSIYLRLPTTDISTYPLNRRARHQGRALTRDEYSSIFGAQPDQLAQVEAFARHHHLDVVEEDPVRRVVVLAGSVANMSAAFGVELHTYELKGETYRIRTGPVNIPIELSPIVEGVFGLDNRPQARPHIRTVPASGGNPPSPPSYTPPQVADLYNFSTMGDGTGQCIGIIELGGGYKAEDLSTYFNQLGLPEPQVSSVSVDSATNAPTGDPKGDDGEVMLDIEVIGAIASGANIVVYFAPNTDRGFIDAVTTATFDAINKPSVISISWGGSESTWTTQALQLFNNALQAAGQVGVTVCCATGDNGSSDGVDDGKAHADFPASSPFALACGGTRLESSNGAITSEVVWNNSHGASGGGISDVFDLPDWQQAAGVPPSVNSGGRVGRGLPDVAADADPETGYLIFLDGQYYVFGGTSAAAPLWAALIALVNQQLEEPVGYINPLLYEQLIQVADVVSDITVGNNGGYQAASGWDACTGLGSPNGANWLAAIIY